MLALGALPTALVLRFYAVLPHRFVVQWDVLGNVTLIGTRPTTVLMIANAAAVVAVAGAATSAFLNRMFSELDMRRAFLGLNLAQIVAINLACAMIVTDALGLQLKIKPMVPPAMATILFAAGILCWRIDRSQPNGWARAGAIALVIAAIGMLGFSAYAANAVVGYFASAVAALAMVAVALPRDK